MIPELGNFAVMLALCLAVLQSVLPLAGTVTGNQLWMSLCLPLSSGIWVFIALSFACLAYAFLHDDFSVAYVARNSNSALPSYYKFAAVWGAHEGSLLLWVLILSSWAYAVSLLSRNLPLDILARVLSVMGLIQVMKDLADIEKVGHGIATAFVATVYGVALSNLFCLPAATKLKTRAHHAMKSKELMLEGIVSIVEGMNPKLIRMKLAAYEDPASSKKAKKEAAGAPAGKPASAEG